MISFGFRRAAAFASALILIFSLTSCGARKLPDNTDDERLKVVTTIFPQYDLVRAVAKDRASLSMMISPGSESHTYEPSVADAEAVAEADLFIYTGGDTDEWAEALAETVKDAGVVSVSVTDAFGGGHESGHGHDHEEGEDEHLWTSPKKAIVILDYIAETLVKLDPENGEFYRANARDYAARLSEVGAELEALAESSAGKTVVVADRFPFDSLFSDYGFSHAEALGGCAVGLEASTAVIGELAELVRRERIPYVFYIEFSDRKIADVISSATGCGELLLHSCHNVDTDDFERGVTLAELLERDLINLRKALT